MSAPSTGRTLFFFEKPSAMRELKRFFRSPDTVCVAAEGHLLTAEEPGAVRADYFAGSGAQAGDLAGRLKQPLQMWVLWPK